MNAAQLFVRCFAERRGTQWQAFCLDFNLAAQADSFDEAKKKLEAQIDEYVHDALAGEDRAHAGTLLVRRKAPFSIRARYQAYRWAWRLRGLFPGDGDGGTRGGHRPFNELLPLAPSSSRVVWAGAESH